MTVGLPHRIAIIGAGSIGSALAGHLILAGDEVTIGTRRPDAFTPPDYQREDIDYPVRAIDEAIDGAEVAILAIPNAAVAPFAKVYRDRLAGAVIIDPSNPFLWHDDGVMTIKDLGGKPSGTVTAELFPKSLVARAFSHQLAETLWLRGRREPGRWGIGYAADDNDAAWVTAEIITQTGFVPIRVGTLAHSAPIDPGGVLFPGLLGLFSPQGMRMTLFKGPFTRAQTGRT
jgi:8-hydroxy-5-deazaflavin:NADPH oxidoreductase